MSSRTKVKFIEKEKSPSRGTSKSPRQDKTIVIEQPNPVENPTLLNPSTPPVKSKNQQLLEVEIDLTGDQPVESIPKEEEKNEDNHIQVKELNGVIKFYYNYKLFFLIFFLTLYFF